MCDPVYAAVRPISFIEAKDTLSRVVNFFTRSTVWLNKRAPGAKPIELSQRYNNRNVKPGSSTDSAARDLETAKNMKYIREVFLDARSQVVSKQFIVKLPVLYVLYVERETGDIQSFEMLLSCI